MDLYFHKYNYIIIATAISIEISLDNKLTVLCLFYYNNIYY